MESEHQLGLKAEKLVGKLKEVAGAAAGEADLQAEGQIQRAIADGKKKGKSRDDLLRDAADAADRKH